MPLCLEFPGATVWWMTVYSHLGSHVPFFESPGAFLSLGIPMHPGITCHAYLQFFRSLYTPMYSGIRHVEVFWTPGASALLETLYAASSRENIRLSRTLSLRLLGHQTLVSCRDSQAPILKHLLTKLVFFPSFMP